MQLFITAYTIAHHCIYYCTSLHILLHITAYTMAHHCIYYCISLHAILHHCIYRMARNFRGTKFSRIGRWQRFREKIFAVRRSQSTKHDQKISQLKFSRSEANPRKPRKFCSAKISRHTVLLHITAYTSAHRYSTSLHILLHITA